MLYIVTTMSGQMVPESAVEHGILAGKSKMKTVLGINQIQNTNAPDKVPILVRK